MEGYTSFAERTYAVRRLHPGKDNDESVLFDFAQDLAFEVVIHAFDSIKTKALVARHGTAMLDAILLLKSIPDCLGAQLPELYTPSRDTLAFTLAFLSRLYELWRTDVLPADESRNLYFTIVDKFIASRGMFSKLVEAKKENVYSPTFKIHVAFRTTVIVELFAGLFGIRALDNSRDLTPQLLDKIVKDAPSFTNIELFHFWMQFLIEMIPVLKSMGVSLCESGYRGLYTSILSATVDKHVGAKPIVDRTLVRPRVSCSCMDCRALNRFLVDPHSQAEGFAVNKQRRHHLHQQLDAARIDCTHVTERYGSPQTLMVKKTFGHHTQKEQQWKVRHKQMQEKFAKFDQGTTQILLGDQYEGITRMQGIMTVPSVTQQRPMRTSTATDLQVTTHRDANGNFDVNVNAPPGATGTRSIFINPQFGAGPNGRPLTTASWSTLNQSMLAPTPAQVVGAKRRIEVIDLTDN